MFNGVDHVVIAVKDLDEGIAKFEAILGQPVSRTGEPPGAGFKNAYFDSEHSQIELVAPTNETGPIGRRIASSGEGVHLVAVRCDDLPGTIAKLRAQGVRLIGDPGEGQPITGQVFVHPSAAGGVLLQLVGD